MRIQLPKSVPKSTAIRLLTDSSAYRSYWESRRLSRHVTQLPARPITVIYLQSHNASSRQLYVVCHHTRMPWMFRVYCIFSPDKSKFRIPTSIESAESSDGRSFQSVNRSAWAQLNAVSLNVVASVQRFTSETWIYTNEMEMWCVRDHLMRQTLGNTALLLISRVSVKSKSFVRIKMHFNIKFEFILEEG